MRRDSFDDPYEVVHSFATPSLGRKQGGQVSFSDSHSRPGTRSPVRIGQRSKPGSPPLALGSSVLSAADKGLVSPVGSARRAGQRLARVMIPAALRRGSPPSSTKGGTSSRSEKAAVTPKVSPAVEAASKVNGSGRVSENGGGAVVDGAPLTSTATGSAMLVLARQDSRRIEFKDAATGGASTPPLRTPPPSGMSEGSADSSVNSSGGGTPSPARRALRNVPQQHSPENSSHNGRQWRGSPDSSFSNSFSSRFEHSFASGRRSAGRQGGRGRHQLLALHLLTAGDFFGADAFVAPHMRPPQGARGQSQREAGQPMALAANGTVPPEAEPTGAAAAGGAVAEGAVSTDAAMAAEPHIATYTIQASGSGTLLCLCVDAASCGPLLQRMVRVFSREATCWEWRVANRRHPLFDNLTIGRTLGEGATGVVKLAVYNEYGQQSMSMKTSTPYAIKIMGRAQFARPDGVQQLLRERELLMETCNHPSLLRCTAAFQSPTHIYLLLDLELGGELYALMHPDDGPCTLPLESARFYTACTLSALGYLHGIRVAHRDLKPENLMLDKFGFIKASPLLAEARRCSHTIDERSTLLFESLKPCPSCALVRAP